MEHTIKRRIIKKEPFENTLVKVDANIDYWKMQVPTYENAYSVFPRWRNNENDPFICTASFKKEYIESHTDGRISRSSDNMLPAFFVYESDTIPLQEQLDICKSIQADIVKKGYVFSQTFSGSKSIHTLVWIHPDFREGVARDFKHYWKFVAKILFGDKSDSLDTQCASIGRLSRNPNGKRDDGRLQTCIYYNSEFESSYMNLSNEIQKHNAQLDKEEANRRFVEQQRALKFSSEKVDELTKLERIHNKGKYSEAFDLAYNVIVNNICPKGANYVSAGSALKGCGFSREFVENMLRTASKAHPTNIQERSIPTILTRMGL